MTDGETQLCNPFSTGGGGARFEAHVQASFLALMLTGGYCPCLPCSPISKIKLQGKFAGYQTDDLIVFIQDNNGRGERKLLAQVKHSISITENDPTFGEVIQSAWRDFNNSAVFTKGRDVISLITGPLSITDTTDVRTILEWARHFENAAEFFKNVELAHFSSDAKRAKLRAFKINLRKGNNNNEVSDDQIFGFLRHFHLLGYDLDIKAGVTLALLHSLIGQYAPDDAQSIWARLVDEVQSVNQNAGTISIDSVPEDLLAAFKQRRIETIPEGLAVPSAPKSPKEWRDRGHATALAAAALLGKWYEGSESDIKMIRRLVNGF